MKSKQLSILIKKPVEEVFEFTLSPKNTPKWISEIEEEIASDYPPKLATIYRNKARGENTWNEYQVIEFEKNKTFTWQKSDSNYHVKYTFQAVDKNTTNLVYLEWVEVGELDNPFQQSILSKLKAVMEG